MAIKYRRDIVLDGTLMWKEFVRQTIDMVRDNDYEYTRGFGYKIETVSENGTEKVVAKEEYWKKLKPCKPKPPYTIKLIGVTVDPQIAIMRGIVRAILTGRSVPIHNQLASHKYFSSNFEDYANFDPPVDIVKLFDNNGNTPKLIYKRKGTETPVITEPNYSRFIDKRMIIIDADSFYGLYPDFVISPTLTPFDFGRRSKILSFLNSVNLTHCIFIFIYCANAKKVDLKGEFNDWNYEPMNRESKDSFRLERDLIPGKYMYHYVVDDSSVIESSIVVGSDSRMISVFFK
eukprot:TRINITY_DN3785_c0_g1_i1.p1 TRINITY_DN3785_c0_g1~~TRINITY_DN3785_c0_g1_i1.p1  ORF type:complete len:289 (-),score=44.05 TRINITY_DN3785_c0_g1_i1:56-922(-)